MSSSLSLLSPLGCSLTPHAILTCWSKSLRPTKAFPILPHRPTQQSPEALHQPQGWICLPINSSGNTVLSGPVNWGSNTTSLIPSSLNSIVVLLCGPPAPAICGNLRRREPSVPNGSNASFHKALTSLFLLMQPLP